MASLKFVVRISQVKVDGKCRIYNRLCQNRKVSYVKTSFYIDPKFMLSNGYISDKYSGYLKLTTSLNLLMNEHLSILESYGTKIDDIDIHTLSSRLRQNEVNGVSFIKYMTKRIAELEKEKRLSYSGTYDSTITHLKLFTGKKDLLFKDITPDFLQRFENHLLSNDRKINTVRIYLNNIKAVFNHAIDNDTIKIELYPFRKFRVKTEKTKKRSIDVIEIKKLMTGPYFPAQQRSVDVFMLIFYLIGINLKDLLYLKPSDYSKGRITYKRFKTGTDFDIKVYPPAKVLIEKYRGENYLLNFLDCDDSYIHYKNFTKETNKRLRLAASYSNLPYISTYTARHSWASLAYKLSIPKDVISEALGHTLGSQMTEVYMSRDNVFVDEANRKVIEFLNQ